MKLKKLSAICAIALASVMFTGCKVPQDVAYFQGESEIVEMTAQQPIKVEPGDKLTIIIKSKDPAVSDLFNLGIYSTRIGQSSTPNPASVSRPYTPGSNDGLAVYTVDEQGKIDFPILGMLKVQGMTRSELTGFIKGELMARDLVKDPVVTVEFVNTGVNILGNVKHPGRYDINKDELTVLDAISMAGDLDINGVRKEVKVLREEDGKIHVYKVDLTNLEKLAKSPVYFLKQNDVVYVEPNNLSKRSTVINGNNALNVSFWVSVASLLTTVATTVGVFVNK
ncbi:MAG: polysaccharide biosynthesis/export family protein [Muribaculaceae bacterium]|nr:polysaccharide biosynthesis/export family protein [Muribaculaceae bacterium]